MGMRETIQTMAGLLAVSSLEFAEDKKEVVMDIVEEENRNSYFGNKYRVKSSSRNVSNPTKRKNRKKNKSARKARRRK